MSGEKVANKVRLDVLKKEEQMIAEEKEELLLEEEEKKKKASPITEIQVQIKISVNAPGCFTSSYVCCAPPRVLKVDECKTNTNLVIIHWQSCNWSKFPFSLSKDHNVWTLLQNTLYPKCLSLIIEPRVSSSYVFSFFLFFYSFLSYSFCNGGSPIFP